MKELTPNEEEAAVSAMVTVRRMCIASGRITDASLIEALGKAERAGDATAEKLAKSLLRIRYIYLKTTA